MMDLAWNRIAVMAGCAVIAWITGGTTALVIVLALALLVSIAPLGRLGTEHTREGVMAAALAVVTLFTATSTYHLTQLTTATYVAVILLGMNLVIGVAGRLVLAHVAFMGVGAYTTAILLDIANFTLFSAILGGLLVTAAFGLLVGLPAIRLSGHYLGVATIVMALIFPSILKLDVLSPWTGGVQGISLFSQSYGPPVWLPLTQSQWYYVLGLIGVVLGGILYYVLVSSGFGRALRAAKESELVSTALGINVTRVQFWAYGLSALYAGYAGIVLFLVTNRTIAPDTFNLILFLAFLAVMVIGGIGSVTGSIVGGLFLVFVYRGWLDELVLNIVSGSTLATLIGGAVAGAAIAAAAGGRYFRRHGLGPLRGVPGQLALVVGGGIVGAVLLDLALRLAGDRIQPTGLSDAFTGIAVILFLRFLPGGLAGLIFSMRPTVTGTYSSADLLRHLTNRWRAGGPVPSEVGTSGPVDNASSTPAESTAEILDDVAQGGRS